MAGNRSYGSGCEQSKVTTFAKVDMQSILCKEGDNGL